MAIDPREIELTHEQRRELARIAERTGKPWHELLREMLDELASRTPKKGTSPNEPLFDRLRRRRLIGCIEGVPSDLSSNPDYMKGFGSE